MLSDNCHGSLSGPVRGSEGCFPRGASSKAARRRCLLLTVSRRLNGLRSGHSVRKENVN